MPTHRPRTVTTSTSTKQQRVDALLARAIEWPCAESAVEMIALEEDCRLAAYRDDAGVWTCGWGETEGVLPGARWTQEYADERLRLALHEWTAGVQHALGGAYANANQLAAMLCLAYNIGLAAFAKSTVARLHKCGDYAGAARAFALWNKVLDRATGQLRPHPVLEARRAREAARYLEPMPDEAPAALPMPQAVQPESTLAASPIAQAGTVTAGIGAASAIVQAASAAAPPADSLLGSAAALAARASEIAASAGFNPRVIVPLVLVAAGAAAVYWRWKQRRGGWA